MQKMKWCNEKLITICVDCEHYVPNASHKGICLQLGKVFKHEMYDRDWAVLYPKCPLTDATEGEKILYFLENEGGAA